MTFSKRRLPPVGRQNCARMLSLGLTLPVHYINFMKYCMKLRLSLCGMGVLIAGLSIVAIDSMEAAGPPKGKPIQFANPGASVAATNLSRIARKTDGLQELQNGLGQPLLTPVHRGSLDGAPVPVPLPSATPVQKRDRAKELLEMRKSWGLAEEKELKEASEREFIGNDALNEQTESEALRLTTQEMFFYNLLQGDTVQKNEKDDPDLIKKDEEEKVREEALDEAKHRWEEMKDAEKDPSALLSSSKEPLSDLAILATPRDNDNVFFPRTTQSAPSPEQEEARKLRMQDYRELYGFSGGGMTPKEMFESISGPSTPKKADLPQLPAVARPSSSTQPFGGGSAPVASTIPSALANPAAAPGLSTLPTLTPTPRTVQPTRVAPKAPSFEAPKRPF